MFYVVLLVDISAKFDQLSYNSGTATLDRGAHQRCMPGLAHPRQREASVTGMILGGDLQAASDGQTAIGIALAAKQTHVARLIFVGAGR